MQKIILLTLGLFSLSLAKAQNVNIPDANFKAALVSNSSINANSDTEIQTSEASAYTGTIGVTSLNISNLTGIEAFTNLTGLDCSYNQLSSINLSSNTHLTTLFCNNNSLTTLNISANTALVNFDCSVNQLSSLNVATNTALQTLGCNNNNITALNISANTALTALICGDNQLSTLNVSTNTALAQLYCGHNSLTSLSVLTNTALTTLGCYNNQIASLNVSNNSALIYLDCQYNVLTGLDLSANSLLKQIGCYNNQLTSLNVKNGNNANLTAFYAQNNPGLPCIQVDNPAYMNATWSAGKDASATFSLNCTGNNIATIRNDKETKIFPNPSSGIFTLNLQNYTDVKITVHDLIGNIVLKKESEHAIDLSDNPAGVYFITISSGRETITKKILLQR